MSEVKKKVLLVDDDIDLIDQNKMLLESKGYEVVTAENVKDAWDTFQKEKPDAAKSLRSGAMCIRLVISCRFGDVIRLLDPHCEATPSDVMTACETVLSGDRPKVAEEPLVKLGQGDMVREILESDLVSEVKTGSWMHRAVAAWRSMRGAA